MPFWRQTVFKIFFNTKKKEKLHLCVCILFTTPLLYHCQHFPQRSRNSPQRDTIMKTILKKLRLLKKTKYLFTFIGYIYTALESCRYVLFRLKTRSCMKNNSKMNTRLLIIYSLQSCKRFFFII